MTKFRVKVAVPSVLELRQCKVCNGAKRLPKKRKEVLSGSMSGTISKRTRPLPEGWVIPGPPAGKNAVEPLQGEELTHLIGHWRIFQRPGCHRWSTDDLVTAWVAGRAFKNSPPKQCLDLGCGIGTVLMMVAWQFPDCCSRGVEAQFLSATMARRSIEFNGCSDRVQVVNCDLRTLSQDTFAGMKFDLITGTPPYFPAEFNEETGVKLATTTYGGIPACDQSAPARYELRGGVEAYCEAASQFLRDESSRFVVCEGYLSFNHPRVLKGAADAGLSITKQLNVHGREDKQPLFAVYEMQKKTSEVEIEVTKIVVRHKGGQRSVDYEKLMADMGIPP